ncbi:ABC transporter ATP-binding protein [Candidiatus Paracoxiella cheracis]|uniref:ABC transporter ATP-binding protein n=1 Tax=Candidiatus Paracoxiella cheracis TaxID=3405120 RepID=UPI003BF61252
MIEFTKIMFSFLNKSDRRFLLFLLSMMVLTAVIELMGIGSLFPYIKILGQQSIIHENHVLESIYQYFHFNNNNSFLVFAGIMIFIMILFKGLMSCLNNYCQSKFTYQLNNRLTSFCLRSFLSMPYSEAFNRNSSVLSKHLLVDVAGVSAILTAILTMLTDIIVAVALISLMIWADPALVMLVVVVLCGFLWLAVRSTKNRIRNLGKANEMCNRFAYKTAADALTGLKDVKVYSVENYFINRFLHWQHKLSNQLIEFNVVSNIPAISMNVMGFGILLIILLYLIISRGNLIAILPVIGLIAVCVQRLLPSANRISTSIGTIRRYKPMAFIVRDAVDELSTINERIKKQSQEQSNIKFENTLLLKNIYYKYPKSQKDVLSNLSLEIKKKTATGIVGESGAGKSTLVDVLLGLLPIERGEIWCDDVNITKFENLALANLVGYVPQQTFLFDGTIKENIAFGIPEDKVNSDAINRAIKVAQLKSFVNGLPDGLDTQIGENGVKLSGGQRQRIGIARALYRDPDILVMDEATNSLDSATEKEFNESLVSLMKEKTLIIIAHRLSSVKFCDQLIQLQEGKIVAVGTYDELIRGSADFRRIYNISATETESESAW